MSMLMEESLVQCSTHFVGEKAGTMFVFIGRMIVFVVLAVVFAFNFRDTRKV
jgi:hypothetical protein